MDTAWLSHDWIPPRGRLLNIEGKLLRHDSCTACGRDFVEDVGAGLRYAVRVMAFDFARLADDVTDRWMKSECPGRRLAADDEDRSTRFEPPPDCLIAVRPRPE
jgi:hypothetical protein